MKIKYADYRNNKDIIRKRCVKTEKMYDNKKIIAFLVISDEVEKKWIVPREKGDECILGNGYCWLQIYGLEKNLVISAIFDEKYNFVETYFDIAKEIILDDIPYAKDLYLDVVQTKENKFIILDENELKDALDNKEITKEDFKLAYDLKNEIIKKYGSNNDFNNLNSFTKECLLECLNRV